MLLVQALEVHKSGLVIFRGIHGVQERIRAQIQSLKSMWKHSIAHFLRS